MPLVQSALLVQGGALHTPPQMAPVAQSAPLSQSLALHVAPVHTSSGQSVYSEQLDVLHLALLHRPLAGHAVSPAQVAGVLHLEPVQRLPAIWQLWALVEHVPAVEPVPVPQELLSQSEPLWQTVVAP